MRNGVQSRDAAGRPYLYLRVSTAPSDIIPNVAHHAIVGSRRNACRFSCLLMRLALTRRHPQFAGTVVIYILGSWPKQLADRRYGPCCSGIGRPGLTTAVLVAPEVRASISVATSACPHRAIRSQLWCVTAAVPASLRSGRDATSRVVISWSANSGRMIQLPHHAMLLVPIQDAVR